MAKPYFQFLTDDGSKGLGQVRLEEQQILVRFKDFFLPLSGTTGRIGLNVKGKVRVITLQGATDASDYDGGTNDVRLRDFILTIEEWVNNNGAQESKEYHDSTGGQMDVNCIDFTWRRSLSDPFRILYTFLLRQS